MLDPMMKIFNSLWELWVLLVFGGITLWAYWPGNKGRMEALGRIPLDDDNEER